MAKAKAPRAKRTLTPRTVGRLRREFVPRDLGPALELLARWDTKACAPGETRARMVLAVVRLALGEVDRLRRFIGQARGDFRDVLLWSEYAEGVELRKRLCDSERGVPNPDEEAFLAAVATTPTDNLTRLVYADWLDDRNDPRGAYVRVLVEWLTSRMMVDEDLFAREEALRVGLSQAWLARIRGMPVRYKKK